MCSSFESTCRQNLPLLSPQELCVRQYLDPVPASISVEKRIDTLRSLFVDGVIDQKKLLTEWEVSSAGIALDLPVDPVQRIVKIYETVIQRANTLGLQSYLDHPLSQICQKIKSSVISSKQWAAAATIDLPPYPRELEEFLAGDCTIWPGKKRSETHIVVPLFPQVEIHDEPTPLTLESLDQLDKSSGGPGYRYIWDAISKKNPADKEFHYAVMTNDIIPGSLNKPYKVQLKLLPPGYEIPGVFDATRAILWENRRSGKRCFIDTYTRCKEGIEEFFVTVGGFSSAGLDVFYSMYIIGKSGVAGWREFRP